MRRLIINADDYGYSPRYNEGILRAAAAGAIDATSAMVLREHCQPTPLLRSGVQIGLHFECSESSDGPAKSVGARAQLARFEDLFRRPPDFLDSHHHRHATEPLAAQVEAIAGELDVRVRCADQGHRQRLRSLGLKTSKRLIGRYLESQPPLPVEVEDVLAGATPPEGLTEWMTHPGLGDPDTGSSFDLGREDDLAVLMGFACRPPLRHWRDGI